ncbi:hypothetical protein CsatA_025522 [Cannabis sativa]
MMKVILCLWKFGSNGSFSVKNAYLLSQQSRFHCEKPVWKVLWKLKLHPRQSVFSWRILSAWLPLKSRLRFLGHDDKKCALCGNEAETEIHVFCQCPFARSIWFLSPWGLRTDTLSVDSFEEFFLWLCSSDNDWLVQVSACVLEAIWRCRNELVFQGKNPSTALILKNIASRAAEFSQILSSFGDAGQLGGENRLSEPVQDFQDNLFDACFYVDASVVDNAAGIGVVLYRSETQEAIALQSLCTVSSVLEAELTAILTALE